MIISQTKIFNIFPGSIKASSIVKILSYFCSRYRLNYVPNENLWINRLCFDLSNSSEKQCLTIGTKKANYLGPTKFRQEMIDESAKSPNFFQDNKPSEKAERKYTITRIKSRNFYQIYLMWE